MSAKKESSIWDVVTTGAAVSAASDLNKIKKELEESKKREDHERWRREREANQAHDEQKKNEATRRQEHLSLLEKQNESASLERQRLQIAESEQEEAERKRKLEEIELIHKRGLGIRHEHFSEVEDLALNNEIPIEVAAERFRSDLIKREIGFLLPSEFCPPEQTEQAIMDQHSDFDWKRCNLLHVCGLAMMQRCDLVGAMKAYKQRFESEDEEKVQQKAIRVQRERQQKQTLSDEQQKISTVRTDLKNLTADIDSIHKKFDEVKIEDELPLVSSAILQLRYHPIVQPGIFVVGLLGWIYNSDSMWLAYSIGAVFALRQLSDTLVNRSNAFRWSWFMSGPGLREMRRRMRLARGNFSDFKSQLIKRDNVNSVQILELGDRSQDLRNQMFKELFNGCKPEGFAFLRNVLIHDALAAYSILFDASKIPKDRALLLFSAYWKATKSWEYRHEITKAYFFAARKHGKIILAHAAINLSKDDIEFCAMGSCSIRSDDDADYEHKTVRAKETDPEAYEWLVRAIQVNSDPTNAPALSISDESRPQMPQKND